MTRPALIVGLGGTGQWVLTYLKKDLIESNGGALPDNVKLLAFDTIPQASAATNSAAAANQKEKDVKVGDVRLETGIEFIHLGGDMYPIGEAITEGDPEQRRSMEHISGWFSAEHWMQTLPRSSWTLSAGAGQLRQFGRLGLFKDLSNRGRSEIWNRINVAIVDLQRHRLRGQRIDIIVVGSFAGGTGSGLFIDIGLLLRERTKSVDSLIRGYFALPRVFDQDPDDDMKARSFAAWRELNRFMTVSPNFAMPSLVYNPADQRLRIEHINKKVYDACYLIDGKQDDRRIDAEPEQIVFPAIADAISALLDDTAGNAYTEWIVANLAPEYAAKPGIPLYSTVGAHSFKVPIYYAQQEFSYRLTLSLLDALTRPLHDDPNNPNRITGVSPASPYSPVRIGRDESLDLLTKDFSYAGHSEQTTLFTKRIAEILRDGGSNNDALIESYAAGSLYRTKKRGRNWLGDFTDFGSRQEIEKLTKEIRRVAQLRLINAIKPSKDIDEDPKNAPRRFTRTIGPFVQKNYGVRTAEGEDLGGKFGDALEQATSLEVDIFRRNANLWLMRTLMGDDSENALANKSGRLGYAYSFMDGLVDGFSQFLAFLNAVDEKRLGDVQPRLRAEDERNRRRAEMESQSRRKFMMFTPPQVHSSQERYLRAEQAVIDVRKDELLHRAVEDAARQMQAAAVEIRSELERWIRMLVTGDPATGIVGLHQVLQSDRTAVLNTANADKDIASQTTIQGPEYRQNDEELERLMSAVTWRIAPGEGQFHLKLSIESEEEGSTELERTTGRERPGLRLQLTQRNLTNLLAYADRRFSHLPGETRVAERLAEEYGYDANAFVADLGGKADPFFAQRVPHAGGAAKWAKLIRISMDKEKLSPRTFEFVHDIQTEMRRISGVDVEVRDQNKLVEVVGSADPHKCTAVFTDDLYEVEMFEAWDDCQKAYMKNPKYPPHLNHTFPAEATAAQFELELQQRRKTNFRVFHPWVVMLLEYQERLEMFFIARALDWIKLMEDGANAWYELALPEYPRGFLLTPPDKALPGLFQAIHSFVLVGQDRAPRSTREIDYDEITRAISNEERLLEDETWIQLLQGQIKQEPDGRVFVPWVLDISDELAGELQASRSISPNEPADHDRAYKDLSEVAALMFEKRINEKQQKLNRRRRI